jgi:chitin disaccharide deacetylase
MGKQPVVRYLIVNGDDFGLSPGVNQGILETHRHGILTSTSLMVNRPAAGAAAALARGATELSVGLHLEFDLPVADARAAVEKQLQRFEQLTGRPPTHFDSHHDTHRDVRVLPHLLEWAGRLGVPVRSHSPVARFAGFYGAWAGECHPEHVGVESLLGMLETEVKRGVTELICHPGYVDADLASSYAAVRETEVETLCDPRVRQALEQGGIRLIGFRDLPAVLANTTVASAGASWRP